MRLYTLRHQLFAWFAHISLSRMRVFAIAALVAAVAIPVTAGIQPAAAVSCDPCPGTTSSDLNLREEPSLDAEVILVMPAGAEVTWYPTVDRENGYVSVSYDGVDGWAYGDYLWLWPGTATTTDALNLRAEPSLEAEVIDVIPTETGVQVLAGPENNYLQVRYGETVGWSSLDYLIVDGGSTGDPPADGAFSTGDAVVIATDWLNLRSEPTLDGDVLAVLPTGLGGTVLEPPVDADGYTWYRVNFGAESGAGWVAGDFLGAGDGGGFSIGDAVRVRSDGGLNCRDDPSLAGDVIVVLPDGQEGAILDGPVFADGFTWWQIGMDGYGPDGEPAGWAAGEYIVPA